MGNTVWTKKAKEAFTENSGTSSTVTTPNINEDTLLAADYGNSPSNGNQIAEDTLTGKASEYDIPKNTPPIPTEAKESINKKIADAFKAKKFDAIDTKGIYREIKSAIGSRLKNIRDPIEKTIQAIIGKTFVKPSTKEEIKTVASHIITWLSILLAYIILINWWYLRNYSTFTFDFRKFIWGPIRWIVAGPLNAIEAINYFAVNDRMDADRKFPSKETMTFLWGIRPILFTVLHFILLNANVLNLLTSFMSTNGLGYIILILLSLYYTGTLFAKEKWYEPVISSPMPMSIIVAVILILAIILAIVVVPLFLGYILTAYLIFLSTMTIIAFNGFWPPYIWSSVKQIFQELTEAYTLEPTSKWEKLGKTAYNNFHSIYIFFLVIGLFIRHIVQIAKFKTPALVGLGVAINFSIFFSLSQGIIPIAKDMYDIIGEDTDSNLPNTPSEDYNTCPK